jgi:gentisate 1,2-dioxygenase
MGEVNEAGFAAAGSMERLYELLQQTGMGPGWNKPEPSLWPLPKKNFVPAHWKYALAKPALDAAGLYVDTEFAERRNLILFNPAAGDRYATARTMITAYQMVMADETARSHRHSPNAMRLVVDARPGAYTVVEGKKIPMVPGDVLLTPNGCWHGHQNESDGSAYWIDFLDAPLVHLLGPMFFEHFPGGLERAVEVDERSPMRFAFADVQRRMDSAAETQPGRRELRIGPPFLDTMAVYVSRLEAGCEFAAERSTASSIFAVIEGHGQSVVDGQEFEWRRGDVYVVPSWHRHACKAAGRSHLLRVTDEPVLQKFNWLRQE